MQDGKVTALTAFVLLEQPDGESSLARARRVKTALAAEAARQFPGKIYGYITIVPLCGMDEVRRELQTYCDDPHFIGLKFLGGYHGEVTQPEYAVCCLRTCRIRQTILDGNTTF